MELTFAFELQVEVAPIQIVGETPKGMRRVVPITGGTFEGEKLSGRIQPGGYDWQLQRTDDVVEVEARYVLETNDGALITIVNQGLRHGPADVMKRLAAGEEVPPSDYYFRSVPVFETAAPNYVWMTRSVFVATGVRLPDKVLIQVYEVN